MRDKRERFRERLREEEQTSTRRMKENERERVEEEETDQDAHLFMRHSRYPFSSSRHNRVELRWRMQVRYTFTSCRAPTEKGEVRERMLEREREKETPRELTIAVAL